MSKIESFKELIVYQKAYKLAMEIFELTNRFPIEEKYSLTEIKSEGHPDLLPHVLPNSGQEEDMKSLLLINLQTH